MLPSITISDRRAGVRSTVHLQAETPLNALSKFAEPPLSKHRVSMLASQLGTSL